MLLLLVVLCLCRRVSFHGFDFLPSSGRTQSNSLLTSLLHSSSTRHGPPLWNLSPLAPTPTPFKPCGDYYFSHLHERCRPHTSFLWLLFPTLLLFLLPPSLPPPTPPPTVMDIFLDLASQAASCFHSVSADCRMSPS